MPSALVEDLAQLLAAALVADLLGSTECYGRFPSGKQAHDEEAA